MQKITQKSQFYPVHYSTGYYACYHSRGQFQSSEQDIYPFEFTRTSYVVQVYLRLNLDIPTHTTVLNWTKKQDMSQFRDKDFYRHEKWVLIIDESIQFGNKKLLLAFAVPEYRCSIGKSLSYKDLTPLILKMGASWKSENIVSAIVEHIDTDQIAYCVSDTGGNLSLSFKTLNCKHIHDINHMYSLMMQMRIVA